MKILFLNLSPLKFNVATPENEPLGGSESCLCYLARALAQKGHEVTLLARLPDNSRDVMGVKHGSLELVKDKSFFEREAFGFIIACNAAVACAYLKEVSPRSRLVLWDHVPPDQPAMAPLAARETIEAVDYIVYASTWQKTETEKMFGVAKASSVIGNGLTPSFENMFDSIAALRAAKKNSAAYTTIPYRGLPLLIKVMEKIHHPTTLEVFSSMRVYQMVDDEYAALFRALEANPRITSHGSVTQKELAGSLRSVAFLSYPCICAETYCISALEAMAAGMKVISTRLGALETTTMGYADLLPVLSSDADELITRFAELMDKNIATFLEHPDEWAERMFEQVRAVNRECRWEIRAEQWEKLLISIH